MQKKYAAPIKGKQVDTDLDIARDKAAYWVFTQLLGPQNAI